VKSVPGLLSLLLLSLSTAAFHPPLGSEPLRFQPKSTAPPPLRADAAVPMADDSLCPRSLQRLGREIAAIGAGSPRQRLLRLPPDVVHPFLPNHSLLVVILGGGAAPDAAIRARRSVDLMHSPRLQARLASLVFQGCEEIVKVSFTLEQTDWSTSFFRARDQPAIPARCLAPGPHTGKPAWGEELCL
jgi:hypothetical protein